MGTKRLTLSGDTVSIAIEDGLQRIGLQQTDTYIEILRKDRQTWFGHQEAVIAIHYDGSQSEEALRAMAFAELRSKFRICYKNESIHVVIPPSFFDNYLLKENEERYIYLRDYLEEEGVTGCDEQTLRDIIGNEESGFDPVEVQRLNCEPIGENGASIHLTIDPAHMFAEAILFGIDNTNEIEVLSFLKEKGICKGIHISNLRMILEQNLNVPFTVARGEPAVDDLPGELDKYFQEDEHKQFEEMMEALTIDTRSVKDINIAERHQLLLRIGEIRRGRDGYTIMGAPIKKMTLSANDSMVKCGENVYFNDHKSEIYSREPGHIVWHKETGFIDVEPVYIVDGNVDFSEGNIVGFVGKVIVKGDVMPHFTVTAEGDIEIHGSVDDAVIRSTGGNVMVAGSIVSRSNGLVQAKRTIQCNIVKNATLRAETIMIAREAINCNIHAYKEILCEGSPGAIIGGEVSATYKIKVNQFGSDRGVPTVVRVGDVSELKAELRKTSQATQRYDSELKEARQVVKILSRRHREHGLTASQDEQLSKAQNAIPELQEALSYAKEREQEIREEVKRRKNGRLEVLNVLYPQVTVHIFEAKMTPKTAEKYTGLRCAHGVVKRYSL